MTKKQYDQYFKKYKEIVWLRLKIEDGYIVCRNSYSNCLHLFYDGRDKIKLTPQLKKLITKYGL